jgi:hypothetical protein
MSFDAEPMKAETQKALFLVLNSCKNRRTTKTELKKSDRRNLSVQEVDEPPWGNMPVLSVRAFSFNAVGSREKKPRTPKACGAEQIIL